MWEMLPVVVVGSLWRFGSTFRDISFVFLSDREFYFFFLKSHQICFLVTITLFVFASHLILTIIIDRPFQIRAAADSE